MRSILVLGTQFRYMQILAKITEFVKDIRAFLKTHANTVLLTILVMLCVLFSFSCGYILAKYQTREPLTIEQP